MKNVKRHFDKKICTIVRNKLHEPNLIIYVINIYKVTYKIVIWNLEIISHVS